MKSIQLWKKREAREREAERLAFCSIGQLSYVSGIRLRKRKERKAGKRERQELDGVGRVVNQRPLIMHGLLSISDGFGPGIPRLLLRE